MEKRGPEGAGLLYLFVHLSVAWEGFGRLELPGGTVVGVR